MTFTPGGGLSEDDYTITNTSVTFGPGLYGVHGDGHITDGRTYASLPIEVWAIDDTDDDDGEYLDLAFGDLPPFVSAGATGKFSYQPTETRVWFNDNEFTGSGSTTGQGRPPVNMFVTFSSDTYDAQENGTVATVEVRLIGGQRLEQEVTIPIEATYKGGATQADTIYTEIPTTVTFKPGQTVTSFRIAARNDDVDDDNESVELRFGDLPTGISIGTRSTCDYGACSHGATTVNLVDDDDPPVDVFFEQANYEVPNNEVTNVRNSRNEKYEYARLNVKVKLSAAPERFVDVGVVAKSIRGGGGIHFEYSAYIPRGPHDGAHFYADDTEFTLRVYISSASGGFDPDQTYRLEIRRHVVQDVCRQSRNGNHHDKCKSLSRIGTAMLLRKAGVPAAAWLHHPP